MKSNDHLLGKTPEEACCKLLKYLDNGTDLGDINDDEDLGDIDGTDTSDK